MVKRGLATTKKETEEGFELCFGVNYLGHFLLTNLLLDRLKESAPARIINVSSVLHFLGKIDFNDLNLDHHYNVFYAYGRSKLCNILFTRELAKRLQGSKVSTYSLHPAAAQTNIDRDKDSADRITRFLCAVLKPLFLDPGNCISTILYCSLEESIEDQSGSYYCDCTKVEPFLNAKDDKLASDLWNLTEELISQKKIINSVTTEKKDL
ncbi:retinol dehydrogenase 12-like isoform X3 [Stegodyphus dumicola]|uniref:retinol dehydrogenase 12-like isoform X3 n=1 Tax=Stegodyphus dumicola TaxID=202533 RepID=UPI0015AF8CE0|nr:retinol dehydrogenase 12-like isoform X3 [Stegodyphus dumicola]